MSTIYILWMRQLKRYFRSRSRIIGALGQPLLFLIAFGYGFGSIFAAAGGGNYMNFLVPGIISQSILFTAISSGINLIWDRQFGFLKETLAAPVSRLEIMLGQALGGATVATIQGAVVLVLSLFMGFSPANWLLVPLAILAMFLLSLLFTLVGIAIASKMEDFQGFQLIINFLIMPLFFLSGALFPVSAMPKALAVVAQINPVTYGVDMIRGFLSGTTHFGYTTDFAFVGGLTILLLVIGSYLFSRIEV